MTPAPPSPLPALERRLRALVPWARGERRELLQRALDDLAVLRGLAREPIVGRAIALTLGVAATLSALAQPHSKRRKARGKPYERKVTDDQVLAAVRKATSVRGAAAILGVGKSTVSRRLGELRVAGEESSAR